MGILAVAPADPAVGQPGVTLPGVQASRPPGPFGGNLDVKDLAAGTRLYLPVFHPGALFYTGDPHSAQETGRSAERRLSSRSQECSDSSCTRGRASQALGPKRRPIIC